MQRSSPPPGARLFRMDNFLQVTPFLHVPDVDEAVRFFTELLGFEVQFRATDYVYVHRGTVGFRLMKRSEEDVGPMQPDNRGYTYYIDIRSMDDLLAELRPRLAMLPPADVYGAVDQVWGQRELLIRTPDRHLLVFGQALQRSA